MKVDGLVRGNWFAKTRSPMQVWSLAEAIILMLGARIDSIDCYLSLSLSVCVYTQTSEAKLMYNTTTERFWYWPLLR